VCKKRKKNEIEQDAPGALFEASMLQRTQQQRQQQWAQREAARWQQECALAELMLNATRASVAARARSQSTQHRRQDSYPSSVASLSRYCATVLTVLRYAAVATTAAAAAAADDDAFPGTTTALQAARCLAPARLW
jgi:hypothetical protein